MDETATLASQNTRLPPCAVQVCPDNDRLWLVGTYQLNETTRTRHGSIDLYELDSNSDQIRLVGSQPTDSSILDVKIFPSDATLVASAQSTGSIILWRLDQSEKQLERVQEFQLFDSDTLVLALAFSEQDEYMSATLTTGEVALIKITDSGLELIDTVLEHMDQCWISEFGNRSLGNVLWTGADDCQLVAHDIRTFGQGQPPIWKRMLHDAGVTSILPASSNWMHDSPFTLWTGGYDDTLKSIDLRTTDTLESYHIPRAKSSCDLGGGVWRLLPSPVTNDNRVLACCMYGGARIVNSNMEVVQTYTNHESMVYGGGWRHDGKSTVTCSFYDNQLRLWSTS